MYNILKYLYLSLGSATLNLLEIVADTPSITVLKPYSIFHSITHSID